MPGVLYGCNSGTTAAVSLARTVKIARTNGTNLMLDLVRGVNHHPKDGICARCIPGFIRTWVREMEGDGPVRSCPGGATPLAGRNPRHPGLDRCGNRLCRCIGMAWGDCLAADTACSRLCHSSRSPGWRGRAAAEHRSSAAPAFRNHPGRGRYDEDVNGSIPRPEPPVLRFSSEALVDRCAVEARVECVQPTHGRWVFLCRWLSGGGAAGVSRLCGGSGRQPGATPALGLVAQRATRASDPAARLARRTGACHSRAGAFSGSVSSRPGHMAASS